ALLEENSYGVEDVFALEYKAPLGTLVSFGEDDELDVYNPDEFDFAQVQVVIFAVDDEISKKYASKALNKGCKIIDCSQAFFADDDVPMIVSGVNDEDINKAKRGIVSVPSSSVTQMLLPLAKVHEQFGVKRIVVSTYMSTSIYDKDGMDELFAQVRKIYMNDTLADDQNIFKKQIAFNVIPQVEEFIGEETACEWAMNAQTKKVLGGNMKVHANCAIVPAFIGCAEFVNVECEKETDGDEVRKLMKASKNVVVFDKNVDGGYVTLTDVQGENNVYVSRLRQDVSVENGFSFWCVADNLRAGIAQNAVSVLKLLV
ncbi:MAG: aspartate-semialdehyde dehydrogenase, partial [Alphaproteobacteria bacterium]|nr:aspartate-semialdehyde dehydrogenase [Alphaproteobacteria bacterium]